MDAEQDRRIFHLFEAAMELPAAERSAYLDHACGANAAMRRKLRAMLQADAQAEAGGFLEGRRPDLTAFQHPTQSESAVPAGPEPGALTQVGPYRLLEQLGRGGMGVVHRASHLGTGALVALKTVTVPHQAMLDGLRREIRSLTRLRHPGIVRIIEEGIHEGLPWYAMELLEGTPLNRASQPASRPARDRALQLVHGLCAPLSYLHGEGLVHRDLKPQNILVQPDGTPVLIDFGLLATFTGEIHRDALEIEVVGAGTPAFMAPEQIRGESCDARVDLYALGCILFELLTGRRVFETRHNAELLAAHLFREPAAPSTLTEGLPAELDELVLRLLAKDPRRRMGHADDVAAALERLGVRPSSRKVPPARPYLYRPGFSGRAAELGLLSGCLKTKAGGVAFVGGQSGIGKTRLALELAREAARQKIQVLMGGALSAEQQGRAAGLEPLRLPLQRLAERCRERGPHEAGRVFGARGRLLSAYEPALAALPGHEGHPEPVELPPREARPRLFQALAEVLDAASRDEPLVLILDDLQWADELTLAFLDALLRGAVQASPGPARDGKGRWLVLGLYRTEEADAALRSLVSAPRAVRVELGRLETAAVGAMVAEMLALPEPPPLFSRFVDHHSEGNPFFVAEYLRMALEEAVLWRDEQGTWQIAAPGGQASAEDYDGLPLPRSLREVVRRRLDGLPGPALRLAQAAAVLGRETDAPLLRRLIPSQETEIDAAIQELLRRQVLEEPQPGSLRFVHDKLREGAYEQIGPEPRAALHRAAADGIEEQGDSGQRQAELAYHWEQAGESGRALPYYRGAARQATEHYAHQEAERLYRAYLRLAGEPGAESIAVRNELGEKVLGRQGRIGESQQQHELALSEARRIGDLGLEGESLVCLGVLSWPTGRTEETRRLYEQALGLLRQVGDRNREAITLDQLAMLCHHQDREVEAQQLYEQSLSISRETGDRSREARVLGNLGNLYRDRGRPEEALRCYEQALAVSREAGDRLREAMVLGYLGFLQQFHGRIDEARTSFEQCLRLSRETGSRTSEAMALGYLARLHADQGHPDKARDLYEQAVGRFRQIGDERNEGVALLNLAELHYDQGRLDEARALCEQGLVRFRQFSQRRHEGIALGTLGVVCKDLGQVEEARQYCEQALAVFREARGQQFEGTTLLTLAEIELLSARDLLRAKELADGAERIFATLEVKRLWCAALCFQGHVALAGGESAAALLRRAEAMAAETDVSPESTLGHVLRELRLAIEASERGEHGRLFRGRLVENLPEGLRQWLTRTGRLPEGNPTSPKAIAPPACGENSEP